MQVEEKNEIICKTKDMQSGDLIRMMGYLARWHVIKTGEGDLICTKSGTTQQVIISKSEVDDVLSNGVTCSISGGRRRRRRLSRKSRGSKKRRGTRRNRISRRHH